jgi:hypothetical protein
MKFHIIGAEKFGFLLIALREFRFVILYSHFEEKGCAYLWGRRPRRWTAWPQRWGGRCCCHDSCAAPLPHSCSATHPLNTAIEEEGQGEWRDRLCV